MVGYPGGKESCVTGKIVNVEKYEFYHNISINAGSSGSPIMLLNDTFNEIRVIGMHRGGNRSNYLNIGIFIAEILGEEKEEFINPRSYNSARAFAPKYRKLFFETPSLVELKGLIRN